MPELGDVQPPANELVRRRWVSGTKLEWARRCDAIMVEHGAVHGRTPYPKRHVARWRARKLIDLMVDLGLHERWELREHVERKPGGFTWAVEYLGRPR